MRFKQIVCFVSLIFFTAPAEAYKLNWRDLMHHVLPHHKRWKQVVIHTTVQIFDPFYKPEAASKGSSSKGGKTVDRELPGQGFRQVIYWQENLLAIETQTEKKQLLHYYYEFDGHVVSASLVPNRPFADDDVLPHYLLFVTRNERAWRHALQRVNIPGWEISFYQDDAFNLYYRIGDREDDHFALVDPQTFLLSGLQSTLRIGEEDYHVQVRFHEMTQYNKLEYPKQTDYFLNDRLFKRVNVDAIQVPKSLPLKKLREKAIRWTQEEPTLPLHVDYTQ